MRYSLCNHWEFTEQWSDAFCRGEPVGCRPVRLPHTCRELPLHYADPSDYEMVCGYRRTLTVPDAPRVFLRFDGAAHQAEIYLNGQLAGQHQGGYTGFTIEITDLVHRGTENLLAVRLDTREDPSLPPFGFVIDYLTYGGLYREVWLETSPQSRVSDLFVYTPTLTEATRTADRRSTGKGRCAARPALQQCGQDAGEPPAVPGRIGGMPPYAARRRTVGHRASESLPLHSGTA